MASLFQAESADEVYPLLVGHVMQHGDLVAPHDKLTGKNHTTRELRPVMVEIAQPRRRLVASRPINVAFALAEVLWILAGRDDVEMLKGYNSTIGHFSDDGMTFNAPYGHRLRHAFGHDQIEDAIKILRLEPDSRQAVLQVWDARRDHGSAATKDRACNLVGMLKVRDGRLNLTQIIRSNDLIWGVPYNWMQWTHVQEWIACQLGIPLGHYVHVADSLHIYHRHFAEADRIQAEAQEQHVDFYSLCRADHRRMTPLDHDQFSLVLDYEYTLRTGGHRMAPANFLDDWIVGTYWEHLLLSLLAHQQYRDGDDLMCALTLTEGDLVYGAAQARFYMANRWLTSPKLTEIQDILGKKFSPECMTKIHVDGRG